jgi:hypothetical protein
VFTAWYVLPTNCIYLFYCVSEIIKRLLLCAALSDCFYNRTGVGLLRGMFCPHCVGIYKLSVFTARHVVTKQCIYETLFHCTILNDWLL